MDNKPLTRKLNALLQMARRGTENERMVAANKLEHLLKKHGLKIEDIDPDNKEIYWFPYQNKMEIHLLHQVHYYVTNRGTGASYFRRGRKIGYKLTLAESLELKRLYEFWRSELKGELERLFSAFIQAHQIFGDKMDGDEDRQKVDIEELKKILAMSNAIERKVPYQQIGYLPHESGVHS